MYSRSCRSAPRIIIICADLRFSCFACIRAVRGSPETHRSSLGPNAIAAAVATFRDQLLALQRDAQDIFVELQLVLAGLSVVARHAIDRAVMLDQHHLA